MHVLMVTGSMHPAAGGPPHVVAGSARALAIQGISVTIFALVDDGSELTVVEQTWSDAFAGLPVNMQLFPRSVPRRLARSAGMTRAVEGAMDDFDLLHVHGIWEQCAAAAANLFRAAGKPVVISAHGMLDAWSMSQSYWKKQISLRYTSTGSMLMRADVLLFGTEEERAETNISALSGRHEVIANGIDVHALAAAASGDCTPLFRLAPHIENWHRSILYFSRIHPKKGLDMLVEAFIALSVEFPDTGLLVVGIPEDDQLLQRIRDRVAKASISSQFALITDLAGVAAKPALALGTIFVLPSHQEGFSVAIIEALAAGRPVLATDKCHFPQLAEWGAGMVVKDDVPSIIAGMRELLSRTDVELEAMGEIGRAAVTERYGWNRVAGQLKELYADCVLQSKNAVR